MAAWLTWKVTILDLIFSVAMLLGLETCLFGFLSQNCVNLGFNRSKIGEKRFPDFTNNPPFEVKIFEVKKVLISTFTKSSEILSLRFGMYTPLIRIVYLVVNTLTSIKV